MTIKLNVPLLRKTVEWAEEQDELRNQGLGCAWEQGSWIFDVEGRIDSLLIELENRHSVRRAELRAHYEMAIADLQSKYGENCGTAYCMAGYMGQINEPLFRKDEYVDMALISDLDKELYPALASYRSTFEDDRNLIHVSDYAAIMLGFNDRGHMAECCRLKGVGDPFEGDNKIEDVKRIANEMIAAFSEEEGL